jgi:hypothetical protein
MIRPQTGQKIPADFFGQLYDMVISSQVRGDGKTISVKRTPSGTTISAIKSGGGRSGGNTGGMFVIQPATGGYKVVDLAAPTQAGIATINGQFYTIALKELAITAPAYILLKYTMPTEAGAGDTAEIISSASLLTSDGEFAYYLIGRIYNNGGTLAISQDHQPGNLILWWQGPCWSE